MASSVKNRLLGFKNQLLRNVSLKKHGGAVCFNETIESLGSSDV